MKISVLVHSNEASKYRVLMKNNQGPLVKGKNNQSSKYLVEY